VHFPYGRSSGMRTGPRCGRRPRAASRGARRRAKDSGPLAHCHAGLQTSLEAVRTEEATDSACALVNGFEELAPQGERACLDGRSCLSDAIYFEL
jgi:hypothetical protein